MKLVRERHQQGAARPRLYIFFGDVFAPPGKQRFERSPIGGNNVSNGKQLEAYAEIAGERLRILNRTGR